MKNFNIELVLALTFDVLSWILIGFGAAWWLQ